MKNIKEKQSKLITILRFEKLILILIFLIFNTLLHSQTINYNGDPIINIGKNCSYHIDETNKLDVTSINNLKFVKSENEILNFGITKARIWVKFFIKNSSTENNLVLDIDNPVIDNIIFFDSELNKQFSGEISNSKEYTNNHIFDLNLAPGESSSYILVFDSVKQLTIPLNIFPKKEVQTRQTNLNFFILFYLGIVVAMLFYNIFLYNSMKEKAHLYYLLLILFVGLNQLVIYGYGSKLLYFNSAWLSLRGFSFVAILSGVFTVLYTKQFTQTKKTSPLINKIFNIDLFFYIVASILTITGSIIIANTIIFILASTSFLIIIAGINSYRSGNKSAKYFILAFSFFIIGVTIYACRLYGIVPYNNYTKFALPIGSILEILLLSFAQANKVNILKQEKDVAILAELSATEQNKTLILNQKETLENQVLERTHDLNLSNKELKTAYAKLETTQLARIEAEKMSSLGQLTAGIAHEINNPINFITNNVSPLKRDLNDLKTLINKYEKSIEYNTNSEIIQEIEDYKKEIDYDYLNNEIEILLTGIQEGSKRTGEIVQSLKIYSHLDSGNMRKANILEGLRSTIIIMASNFKTECEVKTDLDPNISDLVCLPGKLNQVFMNIINNAIHAVIAQHKTFEKRQVKVKCYQTQKNIVISVKDNGIGMSKEIQSKIFDPFFTTKKTGLGTGLGLSISQTIIENHQGKIKIISEKGEGTEFIVSLPLHPNVNKTK